MAEPSGRSLGERLRAAIDSMEPVGRSRGVGLLISRLEGLQDGCPRGANYPSINSYLADEVEPPLDFLRAAASAMGVRESWLAFGEGAMRVEEHQLRIATRRDAVRWRRNEDEDLEQAAQRGIGIHMGRQWAAWPVLLEVFRRYRLLRMTLERPLERDEERERDAEKVGRALVAPLEALGVGGLEGADDEALERYLEGVLAALKGILPRTPSDVLAFRATENDDA